MNGPIEPGHVMSHEAMQRIERDRMLDTAFNCAFAAKHSKNLLADRSPFAPEMAKRAKVTLKG